MRRSTSRGWPVRWRYPTGLSIGGGPQRQWHCKPSTSARASSEFLLSKVKIAVVVRQLDRGHILWCGRVVRVERAHGVRVVRGVDTVAMTAKDAHATFVSAGKAAKDFRSAGRS